MATNTAHLRVVSIIDFNFIKSVTGTATEVDGWFVKSFKPSSNIKKITYAGDGTELYAYKLLAVEFDIESDGIDMLGLETIFGKSTVTAGLDVNETNRVYWGDNGDSAGIVCGISATAQAVDDATATTKYLRIVAPVGNLSAFSPPELTNADKSGLSLKFAAIKTDKDIAGVALPSVPTGGAFWYWSFLSSAPS